MARAGYLYLAAGLGLLAAGVYLSAANAATWRGALASRGWSSTTGEIISSDLFVIVNEAGETQEYGARVVYTYLVAGRPYEANRVSFGRGALRAARDITSVVDRYPEGAPVRVYYDSRAPGEAVLEPGVTLPLYVLMGGAAGAVLAGLGLGAAGLNTARRRPAPAEPEYDPVSDWDRSDEQQL